MPTLSVVVATCMCHSTPLAQNRFFFNQPHKVEHDDSPWRVLLLDCSIPCQHPNRPVRLFALAVDTPAPLFLGLGEQMARVLPLSPHKLPAQSHSNGKASIFEPLGQCRPLSLTLGAQRGADTTSRGKERMDGGCGKSQDARLRAHRLDHILLVQLVILAGR